MGTELGFTSPEQFLADRFAAARQDSDGWEAKDYSEVPRISDEHILVASDVHFPKHDEKLITDMFAQAWREGVTRVVWAGDFQDMEEWSSWGIDDPTSSHRRNMKNGGKIMKIADEMGFMQDFTQGNHEARMFRNKPLNMQDLALMMDLGALMDTGRLRVHDNTRIFAEIGGWLIVHPAQYGAFPGVTAAKLATRFQCNVIAAHDHHWGMVTDETGQYIAISSGGLFDPNKHKYSQNNVTSHRAWQRGFVILHQGHAQLYRGEPTKLTSKEVVNAR